MFTDDLVDTSVPGEGERTNGEWGGGVRRDGMIYHSSVQLVKDIISRSPGKRDRTRNTVVDDGMRDDMGMDALERARRRIAGWPRRGVRGGDVISLDSTTWESHRSGSRAAGDEDFKGFDAAGAREEDGDGDGDGDGDDGTVDPGIDHGTRTFHSAQSFAQSRSSTTRISKDRSDMQDQQRMRGDQTMTSRSATGSGFEKRFREIQRSSEGPSSSSASFRDMSFAAVDTSTPVRATSTRASGRVGEVLGIEGSSDDEETVDSTESSERVPAAGALRDVLRREAEALGADHSKLEEDPQYPDRSVPSPTIEFRTPNTTAARLSAGRSPRANVSTGMNMEENNHVNTTAKSEPNIKAHMNTTTTTTGSTKASGGERSERKTVSVATGEPETPVTHRWSRDRSESSFAARTSRRSSEETRKSSERENTRDAQTSIGRAEDASHIGANHSPPRNTTSKSQNGSRSYIKDSSSTSRSSIPANQSHEEPIPIREHSSRVNGSRSDYPRAAMFPEPQGNASISRNGRSIMKDSTAALRSHIPADQQDQESTIPTRERSSRGNGSRSDHTSRSKMSPEPLDVASTSRARDGRSIIRDSSGASRLHIPAEQPDEGSMITTTREHSSRFNGSHSDDMLRPAISPDLQGNASNSRARDSQSFIKDSSMASGSHIAATQHNQEPTIPTQEHSSRVSGSRSNNTSRSAMSPESLGDASNSRRYGRSIIKDSSALRSHTTQAADESTISTTREHYSRDDSHGEMPVDRRTVSFDVGSPPDGELEEPHGEEDGEKYQGQFPETQSNHKHSTHEAFLPGASRSESQEDDALHRSTSRRGQSANAAVNGNIHSVPVDVTNRYSIPSSTQGLRKRGSTQQTPARSPVHMDAARDALNVTAAGDNTASDRNQSVDASARRDARRLTPSKSSIQTESPGTEPVDLKTPLESAVGRHVLTWFEKHHLLEREEAAAAAAEAEAEEALRHALTVDAGTFVAQREGRVGWWNGAYLAVMVLLAISVMRMFAAHALASPADPFYYATWQTQRLATMRWAGAPFPVRMLRWALRWFVGERELVEMLLRKGVVSSAVGVGRARGRLGVPV